MVLIMQEVMQVSGENWTVQLKGDGITGCPSGKKKIGSCLILYTQINPTWINKLENDEVQKQKHE